jgi:hypothetical protein
MNAWQEQEISFLKAALNLIFLSNYTVFTRFKVKLLIFLNIFWSKISHIGVCLLY